MRKSLTVLAMLLASAAQLQAQRRDGAFRFDHWPHTLIIRESDARASLALQHDALAKLSENQLNQKSRSAWAILASAVLPGAGQAVLRQWRAIPYLALEGYGWSTYASDARGARRDRDAYRLLSTNVARAAFGGSRISDDFEYYERMENYFESGRYNLDPGSPIVPEVDTTTFNGAMWLLARRTYWKDPNVAPMRGTTEWLRAEAFYESRAIRPEFQWSWRGAPEAYDRYRRSIRMANQGYRDAVTDLGLVIGNHFLSTVDAYVSVKLRRRNTATGRAYEVSVGVPF